MRIRELYKIKDRVGATTRDETKEQFKEIKIDLNKSKDFSLGVYIEDGELIPFAGFSELSIEGPKVNYFWEIRRLYHIDGEYYCYCNDQMVYKEQNGVFSLLTSWPFATEPEIIKFISENQTYTIILSSKKKLLIGNGKEEDFKVGFSKSMAICNRAFFLGENDTLKFGKPFDFENSAIDVYPHGYIKLNKNLGDVEGLSVNGRNLIIVCKHGVTNLSVLDEEMDYRLTDYSLPYIDVEENSLITIGNKICFVSENKFCTLTGKTLKTHEISLEEKFKQNGKASSFKSHYILPIKSMGDQTEYIYVRNLIDGKEWILSAKTALSKSDGCYVSDSGKICKLDFKENNYEDMEYQSKKIFFESQKGILSEISLESDKDIKVEVCGDFGVMNFLTQEGVNTLYINRETKFFTVKFNCDGGKKRLKNLSAKVK